MNKSNPIRILICCLSIILLIVTLSSCSIFPNTSSKSTPTLLPSNTPTVTITPSITPTVSFRDWSIIFSDSFDKNNNSWPIGEINDEFIKGTISIIGGKYYVKLTAKKPYIWHAIPKMDEKIATYVTVKVFRINGSKNPDYGLLVRNYEYFSINMDYQRYSLQNVSTSPWTILTLLTPSSLIRPFEPNKIGIKTEGTKVIEYINDEEIDNGQDYSPMKGPSGLGIVFYKAGDWVELTFDDFEVRASSDQ